MATNDRPTLTDLLQWCDILDGEWGRGGRDGLSKRQAEEEALYFQSFAVQTMGEVKAVRTGSAPADVDAAVDALVPLQLLVRIPPARNKRKYKEQADRLTRGGRALLRLWRRNRDLLRDLATDQVLRSVAVSRVLYDDTLWPKPEEDDPQPVDNEDEADEASTDAWVSWEVRNRRACPILWERRNPRHVRWRTDTSDNLLVVVENYETTVLEARLALGHYPRAAQILAKRKPDESVTVKDVWYGKYRCMTINDQSIFPGGRGEYAGVMEHGYPEIPYIISPYRELGFEAPGDRYRGLLTNAAALYPMESQALTAHMCMLMINSFRTWTGWTKDDRPIEVVPGRFLKIDRRLGEYIEMLQGGSVPPELLQTVALIEGYLQRNAAGQSGPKTLENARSAQQVMALQSTQQRKLDPARAELQRGAAKAIKLAFQIIEHCIGESITLPLPEKDREGDWAGEVKLGPKDIDGYVECIEVIFGPRLDPAMIEQWKALAALAAGGWMPLKTSWQLGGATDVPADWWNDLMLENVERLPFLLQTGGYEMLVNEFGEDDWRVQLYAQQLGQQEQAQQSGGGPGVPSQGTSISGGASGGMARGTPGSGPPGGMPPPPAAPQAPSAQPLPHMRGRQNGGGVPPGLGGGLAG